MAGKNGSGRKPTLPEPEPRSCEWCGVVFTPARKRAKQRFCSRLCQRRWRCRPESNAYVAESSRFKRAKALRGKGAGTGYVKFLGRHLHRVMAEKLLGRPLLPKEVVHHIDGDTRNNTWINLEVLPSQSEHARLHGFGKEHGA
jgi:hypothetical protein